MHVKDRKLAPHWPNCPFIQRRHVEPDSPKLHPANFTCFFTSKIKTRYIHTPSFRHMYTAWWSGGGRPERRSGRSLSRVIGIERRGTAAGQRYATIRFRNVGGVRPTVAPPSPPLIGSPGDPLLLVGTARQTPQGPTAQSTAGNKDSSGRKSSRRRRRGERLRFL